MPCCGATGFSFHDVMLLEREYLRDIMHMAEADLAKAPAGKLYITRSHGSVQFRCCQPGGKATYLARGNQLVKQLAQAEYARSVAESARFCLRQIDRLCDRYPDATEGNANSIVGKSDTAKVLLRGADRPIRIGSQPSLAPIKAVYDSLPDVRQSLVVPYVTPDKAFLEEWLQEVPAEKAIDEGNCKYVTENGVAVRSKSEVIIADRLHRAGIPFRYEQPLLLGSSVRVHPDFFILDRRTHQEVIWEHFGLADSPDYAVRALKKLRLYEAAGIKLGSNLIVTSESSIQPLDIEAVEESIVRLMG